MVRRVYLDEVFNKIEVGIEADDVQKRGLYIGLAQGTAYKLFVKNENPLRVIVDISISGIDIGKFIVNPLTNSSIEKGFVFRRPEPKKAKFSSGLITIKTFLEKRTDEKSHSLEIDYATEAVFHMRLVEMSMDPDITKTTSIPPPIKRYVNKEFYRPYSIFS